MPVSRSYHCKPSAKFIDIGVLLFLGLDASSDIKVVLGFDPDQLVSKYDGLAVLLTRKPGLLYVEWPSIDIHYIKVELRRLHRHFRHSMAERLHAVISRVHPLGIILDCCTTWKKFFDDVTYFNE